MSSKKCLIAASLAAFSLSALALSSIQVSEDEAAAFKEKAASIMKDPSSVQFRNVRFMENDTNHAQFMCAEVNAKNAYGGYVGFQPIAVVALKPGDLNVISTPDFAEILCKGG